MFLRCLLSVAWLLVGTLPARSAEHGGPNLAQADSQAAQLKLAPGFLLTVWAAEPQLSNAVAFTFDAQGRCYLAETHRWSVSIFDITQHTNWLNADMSFQSVADRGTFLDAQFAATEPDLLTRDSELIRLVEDRDGDHRADHSAVFAAGFDAPEDGTAAGILATAGRIYFGDIPNLWSFSAPAPGATNLPAPSSAHDRSMPARELLAHGFGVHIGVSGHDLHGLIRGPDGRIYLSFGDRGASLTNREGVVIHVPDCGGVLRCEPDGRNLSVFCVGLRNPQELAFDDHGQLWTVDNDTGGADPCRVLHLVEDGDYGWRTSYQHADGFGPWVLEGLWKGGQDGILPPAGTVSQGPSGLTHYPGTGFGERLRDTFLHCDFPGGVVAFTVKPQGASYGVDRQERFLWNCWPTDVDFGPDGAAYVLDWVAGWGQPGKGRIYRITAPEADPRSAEVQRLLAAGMAGRPESELLGYLGHADRRIRSEAQWELASRGPTAIPGLKRIAFANPQTLARLHALWGLGQISRAGYAQLRSMGSGIRALELVGLIELLGDADEQVRGHAARVLGEGGVLLALPALIDLLDDPSPRVAFEATMALGSLTSTFLPPGAPLNRPLPQIERVVRSRTSTNVESQSASVAISAAFTNHPTDDPFLQHARVRQWVRQEQVEQKQGGYSGISAELKAFTRHPSAEIRLAAALALRQGTNAFLTNLLSDPHPAVVIAAGRAIHDVPVAAGYPALAALITRVDCPTNLWTRVLDAAYRLGTPQFAQMIAGLAKRRDVPESVRTRALDLLADWGSPPPLDKVNGLWRPLVATPRPSPSEGTAPSLTEATRLPADLGRSASFEIGAGVKRNPQPAVRAFLRVADELLDPNTPDEVGIVVAGPPPSTTLQLAVLDTAVRLRTKEAAQPFFERFQRTNTAPELRRQIVPALASLQAVQTADAVKLALLDPDPGVLSSAVPYLDRLDAADALPILDRLLKVATATNRVPTSALRPAQAALAALGTLPGEDAARRLLPLTDQFLAGGLAPTLHADLLTALGSRPEPPLKERLAQHQASLPANDPVAARQVLLTGGDATRGAAIVRLSPQVQCLRCHKIAGEGGTVGPVLDGIGRLRSREYLLESIVVPNRAYAEGFRPNTGGLSAMPEGLAELLTPLELRDVIEYLASLK